MLLEDAQWVRETVLYTSLSRAAFNALERASGSALESEALFNPENQAALSFQENKEGKAVYIGERGDYWIDCNQSTKRPLLPKPPIPYPLSLYDRLPEFSPTNWASINALE